MCVSLGYWLGQGEVQPQMDKIAVHGALSIPIHDLHPPLSFCSGAREGSTLIVPVDREKKGARSVIGGVHARTHTPSGKTTTPDKSDNKKKITANWLKTIYIHIMAPWSPPAVQAADCSF